MSRFLERAQLAAGVVAIVALVAFFVSIAVAGSSA